MTWTLESLPNPRLGEFLSPQYEIGPHVQAIFKARKHAHSFEYEKLDFIDKAEVSPLRQAHLKAAGLPSDYDELSKVDQRTARFKVLRSWYDSKEPNVLVQDVEKLVKAVYLWVEWYIKPAERNVGTYFYRDPAHKYDMIRAAFGPPKVESEPSKTLITAPRGSTKTKTLIGQVVPMMVCCRPFTEILVSEINEDRTNEETTAIQREFEENELIQADFGGKGVLYPASCRGSVKWSPSRMDFIHHPKTMILGRSWASKQRGRHPTLWIIDDPEDPTRPMNADERRVFWTLLFRRGLPMLTRGGVFLWISTLILGGCCHQAMQGELEDDPELKNELADVRFDDWKMHNFDLLQFKDDGSVESLFPDHISVDGYYEKEKSHGKRDAMAELRGIATAAGEFVFPRDKYLHGYMHCIKEGYEYFLDLHTGEQMPWKKFVDSVYCGTAADIADTDKKESDFCAAVTCGVNHYKFPTFYVLDAYIKKTISDDLVWNTFVQAAEWRCEKAAFEGGSIQNVVIRYASQYAKKLQDQGQVAPKIEAIINHRQGKVARILATLRVLYAHRRIRFPVFGTVTDAKGEVHTSIEHPHKLYLKRLLSQLDYFTDEGASGADDGPDALQMCIRLIGPNRGVERQEEDRNVEEHRKWAEGGIVWDKAQVPLEAWTPEMLESAHTCVPELFDQDIYD